MARRATLVRAGSWAERILTELEHEAPLRDDTGNLPAHDCQIVELLASSLARLEAVTAWLGTRPPVDEKGQPWPAEEVARRLRAESARYLDTLGMTPTSRARLGLDLTRTAAAQHSQARIIVPDTNKARREIAKILQDAGALDETTHE